MEHRLISFIALKQKHWKKVCLEKSSCFEIRKKDLFTRESKNIHYMLQL